MLTTQPSAGGPQGDPQQSRIDAGTDTLTLDNQSTAASAKPYSTLIACNDFSTELYGAAASSLMRSGIDKSSSLAAMHSGSSGRKDSHPHASSASVIGRK